MAFFENPHVPSGLSYISHLEHARPFPLPIKRYIGDGNGRVVTNVHLPYYFEYKKNISARTKEISKFIFSIFIGQCENNRRVPRISFV